MINILTTASVNVGYAVVCILIGICAMLMSYKFGDKLTSFDTEKELKNGNIAVAIFNAALVLGSAILSALIIGLSVN